MVFNILATFLFFPIYLLIRWPYLSLPMGPDVGYYVSSPTILNGKFAFCKGWNANYALCSKFIPESFFSLIYLKFGHKKYNAAWRVLFSLYNYMTAILVGWLAYLIMEGAPFAYPGGLVIYGLVSSEPDYGIYYESSEQFAALFQTLGAVLILIGLGSGDRGLVLLGTGVWFLDAFFVKITGLLAAAPLIGLVIFLMRSLWIPIGIEFVLFGFAYFFLFLKCGKNPIEIIKTEFRHQSHYSREGIREASISGGLFHQWRQKALQMKRIFSSNPVIPLLAFLGVVSLPEYVKGIIFSFLMLYFAGLVLKFLISFLPIWWYTIPLLPALAILAAVGVLKMFKTGVYGAFILAFLGLTWGYANCFRVRRMSRERFTQYAWKTRPDMGALHADLDSIKDELEEAVGKNSLFVYGLPVPNSLIGRSYDVPFLTAAYYLDDMAPEWHKDLHSRMLAAHPEYIFDMLEKFDRDSLSQNLGLRYDLVKRWNGKFGPYSLYRYAGKSKVEKPNLDFRSMKM